MNVTSYLKLQFIGHFSNFLNDFVGTIKPWSDIFWTFTLYGGFFVGMEPQIHQIIHLQVPLHSMLVCLLFFLILGNVQVIFQNLQNLLTLFNPIFILWSLTITKNVVNKSGFIVIIKCVERRHDNGHMKSSIVTKLT